MPQDLRVSVSAAPTSLALPNAEPAEASFLAARVDTAVRRFPGVVAAPLLLGTLAGCGGKVLTDDWLNVHREWHAVGGRSTATMMFGHFETLAADRTTGGCHRFKIRTAGDGVGVGFGESGD